MLLRFSLAGVLLLGVACALLRIVQPPPAAPKIVPPPARTVLVGVGDILLGRMLGEEMARTGDYSLAFRDIRDTLTAADITFGNLEGPFCGEPPYPKSGMAFRFRPAAVESLQKAGFDVVSVANNHISDGGDACIRFTLEHLRGSGIEPAGAGTTFDEAHAGVVVERNGIRFAFLAYAYTARNDDPQSKNKGPVVAGRDAEQVRRDVAAARQRAEAVIVSLHDGAEYTQRVAKETEEFARAAIEAGATVVLGHHPHVPQRVEQHGQGWIFYSLGNFAFQQNSPPAVRMALIARLTFSGSALEKVEAQAAVIEPYAQPRLAKPEEEAAILKSVGLTSGLLWNAPPARVETAASRGQERSPR